MAFARYRFARAHAEQNRLGIQLHAPALRRRGSRSSSWTSGTGRRWSFSLCLRAGLVSIPRRLLPRPPKIDGCPAMGPCSASSSCRSSNNVLTIAILSALHGFVHDLHGSGRPSPAAAPGNATTFFVHRSGKRRRSASLTSGRRRPMSLIYFPDHSIPQLAVLHADDAETRRG